MEGKEQDIVKKGKKEKKKNITVKANKKGRHILPFMNFLRVIAIPIYYLLKPFKFYGNRKVKDGACIYTCNHFQLFDPFYIACTTWEVVHFVGKSEILGYPVVGWLAKNIKLISVNRDGNDITAVKDCLKCLKNGEKIAIYPEGTRNKTDAPLLPFKHGAAMLAIKTKTPIMPMYMYTRPKLFRCTHILMGEPMELSEYYDKKLDKDELAEADQKIYDAMLALREEHEKFLAEKKNKNKNKRV